MQAGNVSITADNVGGEVHELVIVRADSLSAIPVKSDGTVNEARIPPSDEVISIDNVGPGSKKTAEINLSTGTYVAFCNIIDAMQPGTTDMHHSGTDSETGHVHFKQGMHATFTVS
jgi:hypothetical protein